MPQGALLSEFLNCTGTWTALVEKTHKVVMRIIKICNSSCMAQLQQIRPFSTE